MVLKWEWFIGGKKMFWISIIVFILFLFSFTVTYIIDLVKLMYIDEQKLDPTPIKTISEKYVSELGVTIDKPIEYKFVKFKRNKKIKLESDTEILLGTFHEWNDTYYINISSNLYNMMSLERVVIHETRHMLVEYMKDEDIIDLTLYTEEIASNEHSSYDSVFRSGIYLLKHFQEKE